jgi:hypothetical protein
LFDSGEGSLVSAGAKIVRKPASLICDKLQVPASFPNLNLHSTESDRGRLFDPLLSSHLQ